jgi:putative salt-induced outer membrane protein YdiY
MKHWLWAVLISGLALAGSSYAQSTNRWEKSASAGLTLTKGNSDTLLFTADILAARKWAHDELNLGASVSYGEDHDVKNNEAVRGFSQWNHLFTDRFYGYLRLEALHDAIADVEYRVTLSPGAGYYFIKNDTTRLSGEVGPGIVFEKQGREESQYFTARIAERFEHKLNDRAKIWQSLEFLPQVDDLNNFIINAEVGVEAALTKKLSLRVLAQDTYDREPAPGRKQNDIKLVSGVAWKF